MSRSLVSVVQLLEVLIAAVNSTQTEEHTSTSAPSKPSIIMSTLKVAFHSRFVRHHVVVASYAIILYMSQVPCQEEKLHLALGN